MNGLQEVEQSVLAEIAPLDVVSRELKAEAEVQTIANDDDLRKGNDLKSRINAHVKAVKDKRLALTRPIDDVKNILLDREREILAPANEAKQILGTAILAYEEEQERIRQAEDDRITAIENEILSHFRPGMTANQVTAARATGAEIRDGLSAEDGQIPRVKLAVLTLSNRLTERMNDIEIEEQRAKKQKLQDDETRLANEKRELEAREERQRIEEAQLEADKAAAKAVRERPKSNIVETVEFEVTMPDLVPRFLCSPDERLIRAHLKGQPDGFQIPGVRIFKTKKVR